MATNIIMITKEGINTDSGSSLAMISDIWFKNIEAGSSYRNTRADFHSTDVRCGTFTLWLQLSSTEFTPTDIGG